MKQLKIIDGDGHIFEDGEAIARHFPYRAAAGRLRSSVFPTQSHIQFSLTRTPPGSFGMGADGRFHNPGPEGWIEFMDQVGSTTPSSSPLPANASDASSTGTTPRGPLGLTTTGSPKLTCGGILASRASVFCRCMTPKRR